MANLLFAQPVLRSGCEITVHEAHLTLMFRGHEYVIEPEEGVTVEVLNDFLNLLKSGMSLEDLQERSSLPSEKVQEFLHVLDESGLIGEGQPKPLTGKSGLEFMLDLEDQYRDWEKDQEETEFTRLLLDGEANRNLLLGWSFEYYNVTLRAHECISPVISKTHGRLQEKLVEFMLEEYRHDKLLMKSLQAAGYTEETVRSSVPLPYTEAVMNLLTKWAHTDPLSFMASLFIFEGTDMDSDEYVDALRSYDMPDGFASSQITHNELNSEGDHGFVSRDLYAEIDYISVEDQLRVLQNMRLLYEMNIRQHENIVEHYNRDDVELPRTLPALIAKKTNGGVQV